MPLHQGMHRTLEKDEEAVTELQLQYGVDPTAFLRVSLANDLALGAKVLVSSRDYDSSKKGPIRQHIDEDDWNQRKREFEAEIQKHIRCNLCLRMCLVPPPFCYFSCMLTGALCPDDQDDIERITEETMQSWSMKDAGRIQWTVIPRRSNTQAKGVFGEMQLMARDLPATSMVPPGGLLYALGMPRPTPGQPALPTAPAATNEMKVISEQPPSYAEEDSEVAAEVQSDEVN